MTTHFRYAKQEPRYVLVHIFRVIVNTFLCEISGGQLQKKDIKHSDAGVSRYYSTLQLLIRYMEGSNDKSCFARRRAAFDEWVGCLTSFIQLDERHGLDPFSHNWSSFLMARKYCPFQTSHYDYMVKEGKSMRLLYAF